jgi:putative flippase GtrA
VKTRIEDNLKANCGVLHERELVPGSGKGEGAWRGTALRWLKFNLVGGLGIAVQLTVLLGLKNGFHLNYLLATALAVEAAVVHNFLWHERYTWADRVRPSWRKSLPRLLRFNLTNGGVSIAGNLALMKVMVGLGHMNYLAANGISIALCSLLNFLMSEEWVFEAGAKNAPSTLAVRPE